MTIALHMLTLWTMLGAGFACGFWAGWRTRPQPRTVETPEDWGDAR